MDTTNNSRNLIGGGLVLLGLLFLIGQFFGGIGALWPLFILLPGLAFLYAGTRSDPGLTVPGAIIGGTGMILLYQNLTGNWESWAYMWALYPVFLGLALQYMGRRKNNESEAKTGRGFILGGLAGFVGLGLLFEMFIFGGLGWLGALLPFLLILGGGYLLFNGKMPDTTRLGATAQAVASAGADILKPKREERLADVPKRKYDDPSADIPGDLRRRIDAALAEDDDPNARLSK